MNPRTAGLLLFASLISPSTAANVLVNGEFEDPVFVLNGSFQSFASIPGWDPFGSAVAVYLSKPGHGIGSWPNGGAEGSSQFADVGNAPNTGIQQTFTLGSELVAPTLSWFDATSDRVASGLITVSSYVVTLRNGSDQVLVSQSYGTDTNVWTQRSLPGIPTLVAGTYTLSFEATSGERQKDLLLDSVSLIPEPGSTLLLGLGSALLLRRRRA